jgi:uncharacterized protein YqgC (DUF456 family)
MAIVGMVFFFLILLVGIALIPFGIAGTFIIVADAFVYGWITGFEAISWPFLGLLLGLALIVEVIEALLGAYAAKRYGGTKWAMAGAVLGTFLGAIVGTMATPVLGTVLGAFIGAFAGATLLEWFHTSDFHNSVRVGAGALMGAIGGKMTKLLVAVVMAVLIVIRIL